jgi:benzoyl-CoA 2,3-dioxygenase component B
MIPNNVGLADDKRLLAAMTAYQSRFMHWWTQRGPREFLSAPMYLRTPTGCDPSGWAEFAFVKPKDYRWGLFRTPPKSRSIGFGDHKGRQIWQTAPQEHAAELLRLIVVQADAEPGSVEQSCALAATAPSLYDLRNLYQFLLEEGRHLWAMVHVLIEHFGAEGAAQADALMERSCGDHDKPRLLNAFNAHNDEWLSYFIWCLLADRDGKYQLSAVRNGAFDPLCRTAEFMLMEEPFHLAIGVQGLERVIRRSIELMHEHDTEDLFAHGGIPLATIQRYLNHLAPQIYDLFGHDESARARDLYVAGVRGRPAEPMLAPAESTRIQVERAVDGSLHAVEIPEIDGLNASMRRQFVAEVDAILSRWNDLLSAAGVATRLALPHERFGRLIGPCRGLHFSPAGMPVDAQQARALNDEWLPSPAERASVRALMQLVQSPGHCSGWIAPPRLGIGGQPANYTYVRLT